ncbi:MAG TPA: HD domain-containing phosphohydrolase [Thermodesulfovibrionales bacterium]|nr:HD domain-containing phosphohydrolase [Thermodesulfovibrionales bacterium]
MSVLISRFPVHTLDRKVLLPAGAEISGETLDALISSRKTVSYDNLSLLQHGSVKEDILTFLGTPPCHVIFSDPRQVTELLHLMDTVHLALPFLESLDYFKEHDSYTYRHILMVFAFSTLLAKDLLPDYKDWIQQAATGPTHDFGKVCVPLDILKKTAPLTRAERRIIEHHTTAGYVLLCYYLGDPLHPAARVARDHHERRDGSGYPQGIGLMDLLVEIICVADVYDALISPRPYRVASYDNRTALEEITSLAEQNKISWDVVRALVAHNRREKPHFSKCDVSYEKRGKPPQGNVHGIIAEDTEGT